MNTRKTTLAYLTLIMAITSLRNVRSVADWWSMAVMFDLLPISDRAIDPLFPAMPPAGFEGCFSGRLRADAKERQHALHIGALAGGTGWRPRIADECFELMSAPPAGVFVQWHLNLLGLTSGDYRPDSIYRNSNLAPFDPFRDPSN